MGRTILYVNGFHPNTRARDLAWAFERYGRLVRCDIPATHNPQAKPYSFVEFRYEEDAEDAYKYMHHKVIDGYEISVQWAKKTPSRDWRYEQSESLRSRREEHYRSREGDRKHDCRQRSRSPRGGDGGRSHSHDERASRSHGERESRGHDERGSRRDRERDSRELEEEDYQHGRSRPLTNGHEHLSSPGPSPRHQTEPSMRGQSPHPQDYQHDDPMDGTER
ncbi:hypothetical protein HD553DRAFT_154222 [Filobasidium floriforme]|uniref:uncharacterized protein n=1 Tax=Filobasidium floriforme TaxID=5210 RepID=UPI001E8CB7F9|nr:uncharacterized protein HD553DRAFT_154222 [Filobasidium floriforme]KAH8089065.1 hypothetical protein HD553DRAFT_154222 [Filobasidium floriforme]